MFLSRPVVALSGAVIIAAVIVGLAWRTTSVVPAGQYTPAVLAPITAAGGTSSNLSFQIPGQIVAVPISIGQNVPAGATLLSLDQASLLAARAGAAANVEAAQARLAALTAGTRPEQIAINRTAVAQSQNALASALQSAYTNADDAIHAKADQVFTNPRSATAQLTLAVPNAALINRIQTERVALESTFSAWNAALVAATGTPEASVSMSEANMKSVAAFLDDLTTALADALRVSGERECRPPERPCRAFRSHLGRHRV
jgi:multidrug efflux pump subunit AcrA (membrane-fusion protein)